MITIEHIEWSEDNKKTTCLNMNDMNIIQIF